MDLSSLSDESFRELIALIERLAFRGGIGIFVLAALFILRDAIKEMFRKKGN